MSKPRYRMGQVMHSLVMGPANNLGIPVQNSPQSLQYLQASLKDSSSPNVAHIVNMLVRPLSNVAQRRYQTKLRVGGST